MSEIVIRESRFPKNVSNEHKEVILAADYPVLRTLEKEKLIEAIAVIYNKAKTLTGQTKESPEIFEEAVKVLVDYIQSGKYGNLTTKQLEISITKGAMGEYGEFHGINAKTIHTWITSFYKAQMKFRKIQSEYNQKRRLEEQQEETSKYFKENAETLMLSRLRDEYERLAKNPDHLIWDYNGSFYFYLLSKEKINEPHERLEHFQDLAMRKMKEGFRHDLTTANSIMRTTIKGWLSNFDETMQGKPVMNARYQQITNEFILRDYLSGCIELGLEFEEVIE